ncbi:Alpha/Beta hydrolase protein [Hysterangium stoloniferum]|nr:Alpha/Beta hydrolase protein [Hysterangium stoloniferum]
MSFCADCVKGVTHAGTPTGKTEQIGGRTCYVAVPKVDYPKDKAILFLTDVFGLELVNSKLLVDDFASNGFYTVAPDYLNGDSIPADAMSSPGFDIGKWFVNHGTDKTRPVLNDVIAALKEKGITKFGAVGYCFGGRYVFDLSFDNIISAGATAHPSLLQVPADLEKLVATSKAPLLICSAEVDQQYPLESQIKGDELLGDGKYPPGYKRAHFPGTVHGFAVRGDMSDPKVKAGKEGAFKETVQWFIKHV